MPGLAPMATPAPRTMSGVAKIFLVVVAVLALVVGIFKPVDPGDTAFMVGEHVGILLVLLALPLLLAWIFAGRRKVRHPNRFVLIFCLVSSFFTLVNSITLLSNFEPPEQRFARLMREAAGLQPESHRGFGRQRRFDDEVRQQYRRLLQQNRDYVAEVKQMDISKLQGLNASQTFADPEAEKEGLEQLHALYDVDAEQEQKLRGIMAELRQILENNAGSASEREAMLRGFDNSSTAQFARRKETLSSEKAWVDAIDDLHDYANAHRDGISVSDGHLVINDPIVRSEFNTKMNFQEEKRRTFLKARQQFSQSQADSLRKMGLNEKDMRGK
ncbi:MAG TPA: hypothetical protein VKL99_13280 [Candidatus Angelobacter sp.]|nr:hypothetical protein [Candidatus Angelobacter sp.]